MAHDTTSQVRHVKDPVGPGNCLSRVHHELGLIVDLSLTLQEHIHLLDLAASGPESRQVLQSADFLTQSLQCIQSAIEQLSKLPENSDDKDYETAFDIIFLDDMRQRILLGAENIVPLQSQRNGLPDFF